MNVRKFTQFGSLGHVGRILRGILLWSFVHHLLPLTLFHRTSSYLAIHGLDYQLLRIDRVKTADILRLLRRRRLPPQLRSLSLCGLVSYPVYHFLSQGPVLFVVRYELEVLLILNLLIQPIIILVQ